MTIVESIKLALEHWETYNIELPGLMAGLIEQKNQARYELDKGRHALRPVNSPGMKATAEDRAVEMDGLTADLRQAYQNLSDLYDLCMVVISN